MEENNYYVYAIGYSSPSDRELSIPPGHHGQSVFRLVYEELVAYVSRIKLTYIEAEYENLECHEAVITAIMNYGCVLPMCFSTICKSEQSVIELLKKYYKQLIDNLNKVSGKIELGIKVFYRLDLEKEDKQDKELLVNPKEYMMKRFERYRSRQERIDEILAVIEREHQILMKLSVDSCFTKPLKNNLIFNASYLVASETKETFDAAVNEIIKDNPSYKILYSGPWPAYHFVNITIEGEENE